MPRGGQRGRGRGGGAKGARGGAAGKRGAAPERNIHVAKPGVVDLPNVLTVIPRPEGIPPPILAGLSDFTNAQPFFSALERLQPEFSGTMESTATCWLGVPGDEVAMLERNEENAFHASLLRTDGVRAPVFLKRMHLLDPFAAMEGLYVWPRDGALPAPRELWRNALSKITDPMNEAYVDAVFALYASKMVEGGLSPHWCHCYGTFAARVDRYMFNISEDYASLRVKPWWRRNQRSGLFKLFDPSEEANDEEAAAASAAFLAGGADLDTADFEDLEDLEDEESSSEESGNSASSSPTNELVLASTTTETVALKSPKLQLKRIKDSESASDDDDTDDGDDDEEDEELYAEFNNFPVQVTLLERADGVVDELLDEELENAETLAETKDARWTAWLFQIIAGLTTAQHYFGFVHNDLHTNNVMWSGTGMTHLYYRIRKSAKGGDSVLYKVPTYGRIMKIIDFGRATYHLPDPAGFFISDAFFPGNDACDQYNCEPFYDAAAGPKVEPNRSFDLSRLAISMLESLYAERPEASKPTKIMSREGGKLYTETVSPVYNLLWEWLQDDEGHNILRLPNGDERYPDFDLYKAIATDVHRAIPAKQVEKPLFSAAFRCTEAPPADTPVYDLFL